ncbi:hypothetical protein QO019_001691 [Streptomyces thermodiastaticus]|uniref:Uncharacterized protein n=1 Tax=Streptomyces thermodiastaticus TaxID=44061 RepID=A0ABU0KF62_9ACTN|nr:hypothetical protein [Streptomyces thermodiastaticus]
MHADGVARADAVRGAVERDQQLVENSEAMALSAAVLAVAGELTRRIHEGVVARGFEGLRPAHGFAFTRLAPDGATVTTSRPISG